MALTNQYPGTQRSPKTTGTSQTAQPCGLAATGTPASTPAAIRSRSTGTPVPPSRREGGGTGTSPADQPHNKNPTRAELPVGLLQAVRIPDTLEVP